jgi:hypothetical protein
MPGSGEPRFFVGSNPTLRVISNIGVEVLKDDQVIKD